MATAAAEVTEVTRVLGTVPPQALREVQEVTPAELEATAVLADMVVEVTPADEAVEFASLSVSLLLLFAPVPSSR